MPLWPRIWRTRKRELEIDEEIQAHLNMAARDRLELGLPADAAAAGAAREFGNRTLIAEITREILGWPSAERLVQDVRYSFAPCGGIRRLRRSRSCRWRSASAPTPRRSVSPTRRCSAPWPLRTPRASSPSARARHNRLSAICLYPDLEDLRSGLQTIDGLVGSRTARVAMARPADTVPQVRFALLVTRGFFDVLGVPPVLGRDFSAGELTLAARPRS